MNPIAFPTPTVVKGGCKKLSIIRDDQTTTRECLCLISSNGGVYEMERKLCDAIYGQVRVACVLQIYGDGVFCRSGVCVALKILNIAKMREKMDMLTEDPLKELAALQYIGNEHPNVQGQIECIQDTNNIYSVMDLCPGGELLDYILTNQLTEQQARHLFQQILDGVEYIHKKGVIHRDLSLENILLNDEKNCKIIDMGQCLRLHMDNQGKTSLLPPLGTCGKLPYRAPEVFQNSQPFCGFAIDIWSLGIILFMLLTRQQPVDYPAPICNRYAYIVAGELRSLLHQWGISISEAATDLIQSILQENPALRLTLDQIKAHPWMNQE